MSTKLTPIRVRRICPINQLPFDCWGCIMMFLEEYRDFKSIILTVSGIFNFLKTNSYFAENITFENNDKIFEHDSPLTHVLKVRFRVPKGVVIINNRSSTQYALNAFRNQFLRNMNSVLCNVKTVELRKKHEYEAVDLEYVKSIFQLPKLENVVFHEFYIHSMNDLDIPQSAKERIKTLIFRCDGRPSDENGFWSGFKNLEVLEFRYFETDEEDIIETRTIDLYEQTKLKRLKIEDLTMEQFHQRKLIDSVVIIDYFIILFRDPKHLTDIELTLSPSNTLFFLEYLSFGKPQNFCMKRIKITNYPIKHEKDDAYFTFNTDGHPQIPATKWILFPKKKRYDYPTENVTFDDTYKKKCEYFCQIFEIMFRLTKTEFIFHIKNDYKDLNFHFDKLKKRINMVLHPKIIKHRDECCDLFLKIFSHRILPLFEKYEEKKEEFLLIPLCLRNSTLFDEKRFSYNSIMLQEDVSGGLLKHRDDRIAKSKRINDDNNNNNNSSNNNKNSNSSPYFRKTSGSGSQFSSKSQLCLDRMVGLPTTSVSKKFKHVESTIVSRLSDPNPYVIFQRRRRWSRSSIRLSPDNSMVVGVVKLYERLF